VTHYTLIQLCHTNVDDAIALMKKSGNNMIVPVDMTCTSAGAWLRPSLLALALSCALIYSGAGSRNLGRISRISSAACTNLWA
jgi:hypothetical protein